MPISDSHIVSRSNTKQPHTPGGPNREYPGDGHRKRESGWLRESTLLRIADSNQGIKKLINALQVRNDQFETMNAVTRAACRIAVTESDLRRGKRAEEDQP